MSAVGRYSDTTADAQEGAIIARSLASSGGRRGFQIQLSDA